MEVSHLAAAAQPAVSASQMPIWTAFVLRMRIAKACLTAQRMRIVVQAISVPWEVVAKGMYVCREIVVIRLSSSSRWRGSMMLLSGRTRLDMIRRRDTASSDRRGI